MSTSDYTIAIGTEEEGRRLIGTKSAPVFGGVAVNEGMIRLMCASIRDGNSRYWQEGESPPGMAYVWVQAMPWAPGQSVRPRVLATTIPLPGNQVVNVQQRVEFHEVMRVGDQLKLVEELVSISDEKTTPLGRGHFVVTKGVISREDDVPVATVTNTLFRYREK